MALTKKKKVEIVDELTGMLSKSPSLVFVNFHGLHVAEANALRRALDAAHVGYKVAKKTLLKRVLEKKGVSGEMPELGGEIAVAYSDDILAPSREVYNFAKGKEGVKIVGGIFEGAYLDETKMLSIATIPPREVLLAQFVNLINSPIQRLVVGLNQIADKKTA